MDNKEAQQHLEDIVNMVAAESRSPQERLLHSMALLGMNAGESLEVRLSAEKLCDFVDLAQRAVNIMFSRLAVYPTSIAMHSTVAALLIANEVVIIAHTDNALLRKAQEAAFGKAFLEQPIRIEADNSLDTRTVAARFKVDLKSEEYSNAAKAMMMRFIEEGKL